MRAPSAVSFAKAQSLLTQGHTAARLGPLTFTKYQIRFIALALDEARQQGVAEERNRCAEIADDHGAQNRHEASIQKRHAVKFNDEIAEQDAGILDSCSREAIAIAYKIRVQDDAAKKEPGHKDPAKSQEGILFN